MKTIEPIFILAGQSNMAGRCSIVDLPDQWNPMRTTTHPSSGTVENNDSISTNSAAAAADILNSKEDVEFRMCWDNDHNLGPGCNSKGRFEQLQGQHSPGLNMDIFGPEMALACTLSPRLKSKGIHRAYFIKYCMGSTNLHTNWNPTNTVTEGKMNAIGYYHKFIEFCRAALSTLEAQNHEGETETDGSSQIETVDRPVWGIFWLQGESDSSKAKDANAYLTNFQHFISTARTDLHIHDLPVVVSPVVWSGKKVNVVNDALKQAGDGGVEYCVCVDPLDEAESDLQGTDAGFCAGHLTAAGLCGIGRRMGSAMPLPPIENN